LHVTKRQVEETFREHHTDLDANRSLEEPSALMAEARAKMRHRYFEADVGITGANFLIAETGSTVIVTNEGNGDLTQTLPKMHIAITSIEKVVPTLDDAMTLLRLLPRSATGQELSVYVTFSTGPRRQTDPDGPKAFHVVLLDNGRSGYLGTPMQEMLRCIRCGACMDHCPVYHAVGGHAYGWVYPGPIGSILTPALVGVENAKHLPHASSLCGRCESVCPVRIPLRSRSHARRSTTAATASSLPMASSQSTIARPSPETLSFALRAITGTAGPYLRSERNCMIAFASYSPGPGDSASQASAGASIPASSVLKMPSRMRYVVGLSFPERHSSNMRSKSSRER